MKKSIKQLFTAIISIFLFFSISFSSKTQAYQMKTLPEIVDFPYGPEDLKMRLINLSRINFRNKTLEYKYTRLKALNKKIQDEVIKDYRNGIISYYEMNGIITYYSNFIYHINKFFYYEELHTERYRNQTRQLDHTIIKHYTLARVNYNSIVNIVKDLRIKKTKKINLFKIYER